MAELTPSRDAFIITFTVEEGERYHFGKIGMNIGLKDLTQADLEPKLTTHEGDWYNVDQVDASVDALTAAVGDKGYAFIDIKPLVNRNKENHTLDITYDIAEGPRVYVERIDVKGNIATLDKVIRRQIPLAEGDAFSTSKIKRAEQNLKNLGFFKNVDVTNVPGSAPDRTVMNVKVEEQSTGQISVGAGYSTVYGLLGNFGIEQKNFLGRGQDVALQGTLAQYEQNAQFSFTEPYFMERPIAAGFDLFDTEQNTQEIATYDIAEYGLTLRMGFDLYQDLHNTVLYAIRDERITNVTTGASIYIQEEAGNRVASVVGDTLLWDKRDNRLNPTEGYYTSLDVSFAGSAVMSTMSNRSFPVASIILLRRNGHCRSSARAARLRACLAKASRSRTAPSSVATICAASHRAALVRAIPTPAIRWAATPSTRAPSRCRCPWVCRRSSVSAAVSSPISAICLASTSRTVRSSTA